MCGCVAVEMHVTRPRSYKTALVNRAAQSFTRIVGMEKNEPVVSPP